METGLPISIIVPTATEVNFTYDGNSKSLVLNNLNTAYVTLEGDSGSQTEIGEYTCRLSLKQTQNNNRLIWADGTTEQKSIKWYITAETSNEGGVLFLGQKVELGHTYNRKSETIPVEWVVAEKLSNHIYALQSTGTECNIPTSGGYGSNLAKNSAYWYTRNLYNEIKSVEADYGRNSSTGVYDEQADKSGLYLVPFSQFNMGYLPDDGYSSEGYILIQNKASQYYVDAYYLAFCNRNTFIASGGSVCVGRDYNNNDCVITNAKGEYPVVTTVSNYNKNSVIAPAFNVDDRKIKVADGVITAR